eukprot:GEMP01108138.1.p1 GENE.GEMP01108138.1~~GEMP01108138.1.p1  ORF type:complete len:101 (+),score=2.14 GEMP01108138.1:415-717(+)
MKKTAKTTVLLRAPNFAELKPMDSKSNQLTRSKYASRKKRFEPTPRDMIPIRSMKLLAGGKVETKNTSFVRVCTLFYFLLWSLHMSPQFTIRSRKTPCWG